MNQTPKQIAIPIIQQKFNNKQTAVTHSARFKTSEILARVLLPKKKYF